MRVLVIDDNAELRRLVRLMLEGAGMAVAEASDGGEGLRLYRRDGADVVLTDLFMPGQDGVHVIQALRREGPAGRVVAMSGGALGGRLELLPMARKLGATAVLPKPFSRAELLAALEATEAAEAAR